MTRFLRDELLLPLPSAPEFTCRRQACPPWRAPDEARESRLHRANPCTSAPDLLGDRQLRAGEEARSYRFGTLHTPGLDSAKAARRLFL